MSTLKNRNRHDLIEILKSKIRPLRLVLENRYLLRPCDAAPPSLNLERYFASHLSRIYVVAYVTPFDLALSCQARCRHVSR